MMIDDVYNAKILGFAGNIGRIGRLADPGATTLLGSSVDFGKLIAEETQKWGKVIRTANIKVE